MFYRIHGFVLFLLMSINWRKTDILIINHCQFIPYRAKYLKFEWQSIFYIDCSSSSEYLTVRQCGGECEAVWRGVWGSVTGSVSWLWCVPVLSCSLTTHQAKGECYYCKLARGTDINISHRRDHQQIFCCCYCLFCYCHFVMINSNVRLKRES